MVEAPKHDLLRAIPPVDELLSRAEVASWRAAYPHFPLTVFLRGILDDLREGRAGAAVAAERAAVSAWVVTTAQARLNALREGGLRPLLNGTGVVLHTNLGRAPLGANAIAASVGAMRGYVSLEVDLASGERAKRAEVLIDLLRLASGAEAAMVVNNNAAAVYLVANSFSPPGRIIVSRGELVEIGGSFRLPEILRHAAAEVVEVGTTNRTYASDYEKAAREGDVLLKVHKSNYAIEGFAHEASIGELVDVGRRRDCRVVFDLGSGALFDLAAAGVGAEPLVSAVVAQGLDAVTMSGDKLLGGVQAGLIVGRRDFVERLRQNPLRRAVRVDKVTVAALQEVLRGYLFATQPRAEIPVLMQITTPADELRERAAAVANEVAKATGRAVTVADDSAAVGGGSLAMVEVPSVAVVIACADERAAVHLARSLRMRELPVFTRIREAEVRVNMATILPGQDGDLCRALADVLSRPGARRGRDHS
jgi:L-seryl-tRNA(Ser) seleniumtransferase